MKHINPQMAAENPNSIIGIGSSNSPNSGAKTATSLEIRFEVANTNELYFELNFQIIKRLAS